MLRLTTQEVPICVQKLAAEKAQALERLQKGHCLRNVVQTLTRRRSDVDFAQPLL